MIFRVFVFVICVGLVWGMVEAHIIRVRHIDKQIHKLTTRNLGKRIVFVSDLQLDRSWGFQHTVMRRVIQSILKQAPDLVIIGGDFIHKRRNHNHNVFDALGSLKIEVIGVLGNHDYKDIETVYKYAKQYGIRLLVNESMNWNDILIYGVDDYKKGNPWIPNILKKPCLAVSHEPEVFFLNPNSQQFTFGLSGHHHAGQITLFGRYAPAVRSQFGQKLVYGHKNKSALNFYVSSGIGGFPIRFFATPEIVVLEL